MLAGREQILYLGDQKDVALALASGLEVRFAESQGFFGLGARRRGGGNS